MFAFASIFYFHLQMLLFQKKHPFLLSMPSLDYVMMRNQGQRKQQGIMSSVLLLIFPIVFIFSFSVKNFLCYFLYPWIFWDFVGLKVSLFHLHFWNRHLLFIELFQHFKIIPLFSVFYCFWWEMSDHSYCDFLE